MVKAIELIDRELQFGDTFSYFSLLSFALPYCPTTKGRYLLRTLLTQNLGFGTSLHQTTEPPSFGLSLPNFGFIYCIS